MSGPDPNMRIVIYAHIDSYSLSNNYLTGHVSFKDDPLEYKEYNIPGYFIVDLETGVVQQGLNEEVWINSLASHGIDEKLKLYKPSSFDSYRVRKNLLISCIILISITFLLWRIRKRLKKVFHVIRCE